MDLEGHGGRSERPAAEHLEDARLPGGAGTPSLAEAALAGLLAKGIEALTAGDWAGMPVHGQVEHEAEPAVSIADGPFGLPLEPSQSWPAEKLAELLPQEGALGDYLSPLPPGELLAQLLVAIDVDAVDDYSLVEVVAAHKRMEAWSAGQAARAAAALAERPALNPSWPGELRGRTRGECLAGRELSMRLKVSKLTATRLAATGRAFNGLLEGTGEALELGLIDFPRAQAIFTVLDGLPPEVAIAAQWKVLDTAPGRTLRQLQQDLAKAVIAVDPEDADARHRKAREKRRVYRPRPLPDGMASVTAVLTAADAIALDTAVDAAARAAKNAGSTRTLDQLRADSLALMGHTALAVGHIGPAPTGPCSCGCTNVRECDGDGAGADASAGALPTLADAPPSDAPPQPGHRLPGCRLPWVRLGTLGGLRADVRITVPLNVALPDLNAPPRNALERDAEPVAEIEGYGPVAPEVARALAAGGVWRRLVTDPVTSQVLDVGRKRYQPPAAMAALVRERDRSCVEPSCSTPARTSELDHIHEWQDGGETSVWNLGSLCKGGNAVKALGAFTVARASDGTYAWTTLTGHGYLRRTDGTVIALPRRTAAQLRALGKEMRRTRRSVDPEVVDTALAEVAAGSGVGGIWTPPPLPQRSVPVITDLPAGPSWAGDDEPPF